MAKRTTTTDQSYLGRLKFNQALLVSPVARYLGSFRIVLLLIMAIALGGVFSFLNLPKRVNPEIEIPIVTVVTVLPGASPEDVESLVTIPLENALKGAEGLDQITSVANQNVSVITLQFASNISREQGKNSVQSLVDGVSDLPSDAQASSVRALDFEDMPIWSFALLTDGSQGSLMTFSRELEQRVEALPKIDRVDLAGFETQEVVVSLRPEKVREFGLNPLSLSQAVRSGTSSYPAGSVSTENNTFSVTIDPTITSLEDLRQLRIMVQGQVMALGEIAVIEERAQHNQGVSFLAQVNDQPRRSVTVYVYKTTTASIDQAGADAEAAVTELLEEYDHRFELVTITNTSQDIVDQFTDLVGEFRTTMLLIFGILLLFLGLRQAIIASFTVPLTFLSAFIFMQVLGMSINFLSLFAFLLALGLLVDDTIVVVSAMTAYYRTGKFSPLETALLVWRDTIVPIWATTLTTIWAFVPLLLTSGIIGEFIKPLPIVVTVTMISSTGIAVLITLPIMMVILKPNVPDRVKSLAKVLLVLGALGLVVLLAVGNPLLPLIVVAYVALLIVFYTTFPALRAGINRQLSTKRVKPWLTRIRHITNHGIIDSQRLAQRYHRLIMQILDSTPARRKVMAGVIAYAIACFALLPLGLVKSEFFPSVDGQNVYINVELPAGTTIDQTQAEAMRLLDQIKQTPGSLETVVEVGRSAGAWSQTSGSHLISFTIHLEEADDRSLTSMDIAQHLRDQFKDYTTGTLTVEEESGGPPVGADLEIKLIGADLTQLDQYADQVVDYLQQQPGVANARKSVRSGTTQLTFVPDLTKVAGSGLSTDQIGLWLRLYASGFTLDSLDLANGQDKTDVVLKLTTENPDPAGLFALNIPNQMGQLHPLESLGSFETRPNPTTITREDGQRTISVTATTLPGFSTTEQNQALEAYADSLNLTNGYSWMTGGANEENQESVNSILQAMVVSAVLILITMVVLFGSFRQAFVVLIVIPFAVSSVFLLFAITGTPLSFPALIGVLSLFGIVVTNSMFIVDKININLRQGLRLKSAIADAGASRLEPIILTKLSTVLGLLPITIADPLWRGLGGAIIAGVLLSSVITLLFIPALYYTIYQPRQLKRV